MRALGPGDWPAVEVLFGERGACGGCWCMAWRLPNREWEEKKGASNKRAFKRLVTTGRAQGSLAFAGREAVGWCSVGPRADFKGLERKRSLVTDWDERTWSVTCFFIHKSWRGRGVAAKLLEEAVRVAREHGATRVEGYPQAVTKGFGGKLTATFAWTGVPRIFEQRRFTKLAKTPGKRPIYVRRLRPAR